MPDQSADGMDGTYRPFETAFEAARQAGLFSSVGRMYGLDGRLGEARKALLAELRNAGATNLDLGRLLEGHANAVQLIRLYGDRNQTSRLETMLEKGALLGVWGADGPCGTAIDAGGARLLGEKRYASGLGRVTDAIVPIADETGVLHLFLVDASDPARQDASTWAMSGMKGSASGTFSIEGLAIEEGTRLGGPGDYKREPFFEGGIWRCAAVHLGALERIVSLMAQHLRHTGRLDHPLQGERLGHAILEARTARLWVEDAAERIENRDGFEDEPVENAVAVASYTRLQVERSALRVMELARRSVGLSSFQCDHPLDAVIADLSVYLRQANPDALLLQKCRTLAAGYLS